MREITWNKDCYNIDGKPGFLISGEFQYFRIPKEDWEHRLDLFIQAGGNCVATYIPWVLHEPEEGTFELGDTPYRDLEGFLDLCKRKNLPVICRPGPYQYSEMKYNGLPGWLCEGYPEILALDINGKTMSGASVSYLHPVFLEKTKKWFDFICPVIARHTVNKGGPVIYAQLDNELSGIHEWFGGWDYNPDGMGIGYENGRYASFLKRKYGGITSVNTAYGADYKTFAGIKPQTDQTPLMAKDYRDFYLSNIADYCCILAEWMRDSGIDCDLIHNSANPGMNPYFLETIQALGDGFMLGSDMYYNLHLDWEANNPTPKQAVKALICHDELKLMGFPSTIHEMQAGSCSDWPPILPEDLLCWYMTNIAFGMKGLNYYVFTGGNNPEGIGGDGLVYDYGAGIAPDNTIRPIYHMQKAFGEFLNHNKWLSQAERESDYYLGLDWEHARNKDDEKGGYPNAWEFMQKGLIITSMCASLSPILVDLNDPALKIDKPLVIASSERMNAGIQQNLVDYVKRGGKVLLTPVIPSLGENYEPCTILSDFLGGASTNTYSAANMEVCLGEAKSLTYNGLWTCDRQPKGAVPIAFDNSSDAVLGWHTRFCGSGAVVWLGIKWSHNKNLQIKMLRDLFKILGVETAAVECENPNVWAVLRSDGKRRMLFLMNLFSSPLDAGIRVREMDGSYADLGSHSLKPMEVKTVIL